MKLLRWVGILIIVSLLLYYLHQIVHVFTSANTWFWYYVL
jgi:hypothetical protein